MADLRHHVGFVDATREGHELRESFLYTPQYDDLRQRDRCFVAGRRGSGKSAHAMMLADKWPISTLCTDPESQFERYQDIVESLIDRQRHGTVNIQRCMQSLWAHTLRVLIFQTLAANADKLQSPEMAAPFRRYLEEHAIESATLGQILLRAFNPASERASRSSDQFGLMLAADLGELEADRDARSLLDRLPAILGSQRMLILVDSLERYAIFRTEMQEALGGIARAIVGIKANKAASAVDIRFFMPAEIFDYISPEMPGKVLGETVFLRWRFHHLLAMLTIRYLEMLRRTNLEPEAKVTSLHAQVHDALNSDSAMRDLRKEFWYANAYLPSHITNHLGSREDTFAYILRHTQRRPRELIFVLNQIIDESLHRHELPQISPEAVRIGVHAPGTLQFLVRDSLSPFAGPDRDMVELARIIFHEHQRLFSARELLRWAKRLRDLGKLENTNEEAIIQALLRSGVVGEVERHTEHYTIARFEYLMQDHLQLIVEHAQQYCVHPTLADFFRMETPKNTKAIYPLPEADEWLESDLGIAGG
jgi:hypothetical protein